MAIDSGYWETSGCTHIDTDDVAALLVNLYADYKSYSGGNDDYAKVVGIAIRILND